MNIKEYTRLKENLSRSDKEASQAEGALKEVMGRLEGEFGVSSIKGAKSLLKDMEKEESELEAEYGRAKAGITKEHPELED